MGVAILASMRSKDPSTQVGACIIDGDKRILSTGYNGFPQGCSDDEFPWNRDESLGETKYQYVVHAELNAILNASGKKLAGILTEGKGKCEGVLSYAIVGIGINLLKQEFPEEVKDIATTVEDECGKDVDINLLTARIVKKFFDNLNLVGTKELAEEYKSRCFLIGCDVTVIKPTANYPATVKDITDRCELIITLPDGNEEILSTGEVSIRPKS